MSITTIASVVLALLAVAIHVRTLLRNRKLPPGPPGDPFIGHLRHMPSNNAYVYINELNNKYGDVASINAFGKPIIVVKSFKIVNELLAKRGAHYSGRPRAAFVEEVLDMWRILGVYPYNATWRELRRVLHTQLGKDTAREPYRPDAERNAYEFVLRSIESKKNISSDYDIAINKTIIEMAYGIRIRSDDDEILKTTLKMGEILSAQLLPGKHLSDNFPFLLKLPSWFPGSPWTPEAKEWRELFVKMLGVPWQKVKEAEAGGVGNHSFALSLMHETTTLDEEYLKTLTATTLIAGAETTATLVQNFIFSLLAHPETQKKAQEEIDRVIGLDRLPNADDIPNLPYSEAVIKEVMRWRPISPIGLPHELTKDDTYEGWSFPKGSLIVQNSWAMSFDEDMYPKAQSFIPERHLAKNTPMDPKLYSFGIGRRICPGMAVAELIYTPVLLTILATANVVKERDAQGNEITPSGERTGRLTDAPLPFVYRFKARSEAHVALLRSAIGA